MGYEYVLLKQGRLIQIIQLGFDFPVIGVPPTAISPEVSSPSAPVISPAIPTPVNSTNANEPSTATGLSSNDKIIVGVLVGVGAPMIAGAIALILMRKKLHSKGLSKEQLEANNSVYTSINLTQKYDPLSEKKMHIPSKHLTIGKSIGAGSFGKVFVGYDSLILSKWLLI